MNCERLRITLRYYKDLFHERVSQGQISSTTPQGKLDRLMDLVQWCVFSQSHLSELCVTTTTTLDWMKVYSFPIGNQTNISQCMEIFVNMDKRTSSLSGCLSFALHLHYNSVSYYEWLLLYALFYIKGTKYAAVRYSFFVQLVVLDFTWPVYIAQICFSLSFQCNIGCSQ